MNESVYQPIKGFTQQHPSSVIFINKYGKVISCDAKIYQELYDQYEIYWQVLIDGQWQRAEDVAELRSIKPNGFLIFYPFRDNQFQDKIHDTEYQCLISFKYGVIGTTWIKVKASKSQLGAMFFVLQRAYLTTPLIGCTVLNKSCCAETKSQVKLIEFLITTL